MNKLILALAVLLLSVSIVEAKHIHTEKEYQTMWCNAHGGAMEVKTPDLARIDCLTGAYAVEFDFASKWAESIGQSLYYGITSGKIPAVVLIMENGESDIKYLNRLNAVAKKHGITVFTMKSLEDTGVKK